MYNEGLLTVVNKMSDDNMANSAYYTSRRDSTHQLVIMTATGIMIVEFMSDGVLVAPNGKEQNELDEIEYGFGTVLQRDKERMNILFDEDGALDMSNADDIGISIDNVIYAGSMEELAELVDDGEVDDDIYEKLDIMEIMLG